jgi:hypothetical protein
MKVPTTSLLSFFDIDKESRKAFAESLILGLKEGLSDPLKIHYQIKCIEDFVKTLTSDAEYKTLLLDEASKYGKSFEHLNARFEVKEMGVKYDYSVCNDPTYNKLKAQLTIIEDELKAREKYLKAIPPQGVQTLLEDEVVTLYPPAKSSTTSITVNLK